MTTVLFFAIASTDVTVAQVIPFTGELNARPLSVMIQAAQLGSHQRPDGHNKLVSLCG